MQKNCTQCSAAFEVTKDDLAFYDKVSPVFDGKKYAIPPPTLCPDCRVQRRYAFRNERKLYRRTCDATGKDIISVYEQDAPYTVYAARPWWSDDWNAMDIGRDYDFKRPFFDQLREIQMAVPHIGLYNVQCENSDYANQCGWSRNCYMAIATDFSENCYYTDHCIRCRNCVDGLGLHESELCYECVDCVKCYSSSFCRHCSDCSDCSFCYDCKGCRNCIGCTGLRNKQYYIDNEEYSPAEWKAHKQTMYPLTKARIAKQREQLHKNELKLPHRYAVITNCQDCTGNYLSNSKNAKSCYDVADLEDAKFCSVVPTTTKDVYDVTGGGGELLYECVSTGPGHNTIACLHCWDNVSNLLYCIFCMNGTQDCFGCVGLKKQQYCIFNKQYSKEEYEALAAKIIEHMQATNEWGEFLPMHLSPFAYNETIAQDYFPLTETDVGKRGWKWKQLKDDIPGVKKVIPAEKLPESIDQIPDDILNWAIVCEETKRPFKIIKQELEFYHTMKLPIPHFHPDERHKRRMALRNPRRLWERKCDKCRKDIETTYAPERKETVYCEECYLAEVY